MASITFFYSTPYAPNASKTEPVLFEQPIGAQLYIESLGYTTTSFDPATVNLDEIFRARKAIARSVAFYGDRLPGIAYLSTSFQYLNEHQRIALKEELENTADLIYKECLLHHAEGNAILLGDTLLLKERVEQWHLCAKLRAQLRETPERGKNSAPEQLHQSAMSGSSDQPARYVALTVIAPLIAETMLNLTEGKNLESIQKKMTDVNFFRLNWVWGGGLDRALLDCVPEGQGHTQHARNIFATVSPITGYMSWILYYLRLGINLYLLTRGTLKGSWMDPWRDSNDIAMNIGVYERFQTQWEQRKFAILNDCFWATANMACFLWLVNDGVFGYTAYMGNALTGVLLLMDLALTAWGYLEKETEYNQVMTQYQEDIINLQKKIIDAPNQKVLEIHLAVLIEAQEKCRLDWEYAYKNFYHDLLYAAGLLAAFSLLCCFFFPPAAIVPATALLLGVVGAALSFVFTIVHNAMETNTKIEKLREVIVKTGEKINKLAKDLRDESDENQHERLRLAIDHLEKKLAHHHEMITHHKREMFQQILSEALLPTTAFVFLVFLPLSLGLPMMIPVIALLMLSGTILAQYKPEDPELSHVNGMPNPMNPA